MTFERQIILSFAAIVVGFVAVFYLSEFVSARRISLPESYADTDLDLQGHRLRGFALGAEGLLADWYWIRSLQYVGDKVLNHKGDINIEDLRPLNPRLLYPLLDNATDLDPHFMAAYSYGAIVLPAIDPDLAVRLTEKGIANNPESWRLYQYLGYIHWRNGDHDRAAAAYDAGSRFEGAALFMRQMAALVRAQGGSRDTARLMYLQLAAEAEDEQARATAELRLRQLHSLDQRDLAYRVMAEIRERTGRCPTRTADLLPYLQNGELTDRTEFQVNERGELLDPTGIPYTIDPSDCRLELSGESRIPRR